MVTVGENIFVVAAVVDDDDFPVDAGTCTQVGPFGLVNNRTVPRFMPFHWKLKGKFWTRKMDVGFLDTTPSILIELDEQTCRSIAL